MRNRLRSPGDLFPTDNAAWRKILEASIAAGADIDPPLSPDFAEKYPASRTLVSIELVRLAIERGLKETCGAPLSDCLVMMRLGEATRPLRVNDIGESLEMPTANVTRAVDRLVQRGWVKRMGSERDRKAVFVAHRRWEFHRTHYRSNQTSSQRNFFEQVTPVRPGSHRRCGIGGYRRLAPTPRRRAQRGFCRLATDRLGTNRKRDATEKLSYAEPLLGYRQKRLKSFPSLVLESGPHVAAF